MASRAPAPPTRTPITTVGTGKSSRQPVSIIGAAGSGVSSNGNSDTITAGINWDLSGDSLSASKHNLSLVGSGNLGGYGNSLLWNRLDARSNSGNSTLYGGPSANAVAPASMLTGPSSSTLYGGSGNDVLLGWTGARTQNSTATASSGSTRLVVSSATGFVVGQYLGGTGITSGTQITAISGTTLTLSKATIAAISGGTVYSLPVAASSTTTAAKGATTLALQSASQFYTGQIISGTGIGSGTTIKSISGNTVTLSTPTTAAVSGTIIGLDSATPPAGFAPNTDLFIGGSGSSTIYAGNVASTLLGGSKNNLLVADTISGANQSLWGGNNTGSSLYGNTLYGGTGKDTLRSGSGYNTLISGSTTAGSPLSLASSLASGSQNLSLASTSGLTVGQMITGPGIADGTSITAVGNSWVTADALRGTKSLTLASLPSTYKVGQVITGTGIAAGTIISAISGTTITLSTAITANIAAGSQISNNIVTLSASTTTSLPSGSSLAVISQVLLGGGISNSLVAGAGNDSLAAISGKSTLIGGIGKDTLTASPLSSSANWLQSGSTGTGNTLRGGAGSNTLVPGSGGHDSIIGGTARNLLLLTSANNNASFITDTISLSTLYGAQNTLGVSLSSPGSVKDSLLASMASQGVRNLGTIRNLNTNADSLIMGSNAEKVGIQTLVAGGSDTLSVAAYTMSGALLDGSAAARAVNLIGTTVVGNAFGDTFKGSQNGYDVMTGSANNDLFILQNAAANTVTGGMGTDTLQLLNNAALGYQVFNAVSGIEALTLAGGTSLQSGVNSVGSLQGSGISTIYGGAGVDSDVITASVASTVKNLTAKGARTITLVIQPGASGTMGFAQGQFVSGNGIPAGTYIDQPVAAPVNGTITLHLSQATSAQIGSGTLINGWLNNFTIDGSKSTGQNPTTLQGSKALDAVIGFANASDGIYQQNKGLPNELNLDVQTFLGLQNDPRTYIQTQGDSLVVGGYGEMVKGAISTAPDSLLSSSIYFTDSYNNKRTGISFLSHVVTDNTIVSGMFNSGSGDSRDLASNTLVGGPGQNLYILNNIAGDTLLPFIQNNSSLQSGSTIRFTSNGIQLSDSSFAQVGAKTAQIIQTANGNNLISIGLNAAPVGIQTIIGGVGSDTFVTGLQQGSLTEISLTADAISGDTLLYVADTTGISIGNLIAGAGIPDGTTVAAIDSLNGSVLLSQSITQDLSLGDTLSDIPLVAYTQNVLFDASKNGGNTSLASGSGNDTLLGGAGSSTLLGGDGNNSLRGGNGNNLIKSGIGNSTLDSGYGTSTLQADGGTNTFVVRNRYTRILSPDTLNPKTGTIPEVGIVNTYVNFDPIQGSPVSQFSPYYPDNSPSITKSPSFASSDLSSFYNLQYYNLLGSANYGVGNALDNTLSAAAANALILGMGGNNTIVASGANSSLYGNSNADYASPDLYAYAPIDTRTQAFVDGVMGVSGNNSLVASGTGSYLDGGSGYDDGLFDGSGSNTLVGTGGNDTLIVSHQADFVSLQGSSNTVITSVDLFQAPDNVSDLIVNVTPQFANSGEVAFAGQRMTASYAAIAGATGGYTDTNSITAGLAPSIVVEKSTKLQVAYGISDGTVYGSDNVADANLPLTVGSIIPDPKNPGKDAVTLSWTTPLTPEGNPVGQTMGYLVNYQLVASTTLTLTSDASAGDTIIFVADASSINVGEKVSGNGIPDGATIVAVDPLSSQLTLSSAITQDIFVSDTLTAFAETPYLTYLKGTSSDLTGTATDPQLLVDNLPTSFTDPYTGVTYDSSNSTIAYNFKVTAQETVLPAYTNENGDLIAQPVSLLGGQGNDVIYGGLLQNSQSSVLNTRPALANNPNPLDNLAGLIPAPYGSGNAPLSSNSGLFPVYEGGGLGGNDLLAAPLVNDGSGNNFTAYEYLNGVPTPVTFSGLCTLEGGLGSDTFYVANGGTSLSTLNGIVSTGAYDNIIKYGNETPAGQHNLVISGIQYLSLSDTVVNQGQFIDQAWAPYGGQYIGGNRLDNTLKSYFGTDTLLGGGGRDLLDASGAAAGGDTLIGGTAYGLDSIAGALADYTAGRTNSIYRDTDPIPVQPNGPGTADNSQYWFINGGFDPFRNSDTLLGATLAGNILDGGAGNDSMVGGTKNDTLYVSDAFGIENNPIIEGGDVVIGGGGNDWIVYTGSDLYWSGRTGATTAIRGYALSNNGDGAGGQSISNIKLQDGDPIARVATGNLTASGNAQGPGSNILVGNEFNNTLNGAGVGGVNQSGTGVDVLTGGGGADYFIISGYTASSSDKAASYILPISSTTDTLSGVTTTNYQLDPGKYRTDKDYAIITDMSSADTIVLGGASNYLIGKAPSSFGDNNIGDSALITSASTDFGIYTRSGNLVAEIKGIAIGTLGAIATVSATAANSPSTVTATIDGQASTGAEPNHLGGSNFFSTTSNAGVINSGTALNYLGMGPMYELSGSAFASHVI
jgi:Ca2+-binding RTX toxin-like protein